MLRVRRRGTTPLVSLTVVAILVTSLGLVAVRAGATSIAATQAEIAHLSAALSQQEKTSEITANRFDAERASLAPLSASIAALQVQEATKRVAVAVTASALERAVVRAYVFGAADAQALALFNQNVTTSDARAVYEDQVIGNLNRLKDSYVRAKISLEGTVARVASERARARRTTAELRSMLSQNIQLANSTQATLDSVTAELKSEIINYEISAGAAAARAQNAPAEEQAIAAASAVGGQSAANRVIEAIQANTPATPAIAEVAGTAQGLQAVAYAESQIGVPYVWGGETAGVGFDCSGLVQWAWGKVGITIPRTTEVQYPDMLHVPLTDLQPGDLLFYYNLDGDHAVDHVVMYVGSGPWGVDTTIAAAHTGTNVSLAPLFTAGLIGAARP